MMLYLTWSLAITHCELCMAESRVEIIRPNAVTTPTIAMMKHPAHGSRFLRGSRLLLPLSFSAVRLVSGHSMYVAIVRWISLEYTCDLVGPRFYV